MLFKSYKKIIESIFNGITSGQSTATVQDYLTVVGWTFAIIGTVVGIILLFAGALWIPKKVISVTTKGLRYKIAEMEKRTHNEWTDTDKIAYGQLMSKLRTVKIVDWCVIVLVYVPVIIPLILIVMDIVLKLFH